MEDQHLYSERPEYIEPNEGKGCLVAAVLLLIGFIISLITLL